MMQAIFFIRAIYKYHWIINNILSTYVLSADTNVNSKVEVDWLHLPKRMIMRYRILRKCCHIVHMPVADITHCIIFVDDLIQALFSDMKTCGYNCLSMTAP